LILKNAARLFVGSYKRYKSDTDRLIQWLTESAVTLGYELKLEAQQLPKKKNKKKKKKTVTPASPQKHKISSSKFLIIAQTISESAIAVPAVVLQFARQAASCRKRCAKWFMGRSEHEASNQTHQNFISVIENVADILERGIDNASTTTKVPEIHTHANIKQLNNMFEHLELEDPNELAASKAEPSTLSPPATYELNEDESEPTPNPSPNTSSPPTSSSKTCDSCETS
jgi:hypothetical protein